MVYQQTGELSKFDKTNRFLAEPFAVELSRLEQQIFKCGLILDILGVIEVVDIA